MQRRLLINAASRLFASATGIARPYAGLNIGVIGNDECGMTDRVKDLITQSRCRLVEQNLVGVIYHETRLRKRNFPVASRVSQQVNPSPIENDLQRFLNVYHGLVCVDPYGEGIADEVIATLHYLALGQRHASRLAAVPIFMLLSPQAESKMPELKPFLVTVNTTNNVGAIPEFLATVLVARKQLEEQPLMTSASSRSLVQPPVLR